MAAVVGAVPYEHDCFDQLRVPEGGSASSEAWFVFGERCVERNGPVSEATVFYWYSLAAAIAVGAAVWFAVAGLLRVTPARQALLGWSVSALGLLIATVIFFAGS